MGLIEIFDALKAGIDERYGDKVEFAGPSEKDHNSRPPRISWEPVGARIIAKTTGAGGGPDDDGPIATREWEIDVEIWGRSPSDDDNLGYTEALVSAFYEVAHDYATALTFPTDYVEDWKLGGQSAHGVKCLIRMHVLTPVPRTPIPTVLITAANNTKVIADQELEPDED